MKWENKIFQNHTNNSFEATALEIFKYQAKNNTVYKTYLKLLNVNPKNVKNLSQIPFLPIEFFKHQDVVCKSKNFDTVFTSSGTSGKQSKHIVERAKWMRGHVCFGLWRLHRDLKAFS